MGVKYSNNASTTLPSGINDSVTSITVTSASSFPAISSPNYAYLTLVSATALEVVKCTNISGNVLTVLRAQESTTAAAFVADDRVELRVTTAMLTDALAETVAAAATSATNAAASETNAAASYDNFDDRWLGSKSSDPSVDNDGATLVDGAAYFNTTNNVLMVYDLGGTTWNRTTPTSAEQTNINTLAAAAVVTDMSILATADIIADMAILGTADVVTDMNVLATADVVTDMNVLGTADVVADMNVLGTADVVSDMNTLGTADVVTDMNVLATADVVADMNTLGTADVVADLNTLGTADVVTDMNTLGTAANVTAMSVCADNLTGINNFAATYSVASSNPSGGTVNEGDIFFNTTDNQFKYYNGTSWASVTAGIGSMADDTSPQLGGDLDVQTNDIVSTSNRAITITPNGTGDVILDGLKYPQADGTIGQFLKTNGSAQLSFETIQGGDLSTQGTTFANYNTISSDVTTTTLTTKNMFLMGSMSVTGTTVWTIAGNGILQII